MLSFTRPARLAARPRRCRAPPRRPTHLGAHRRRGARRARPRRWWRPSRRSSPCRGRPGRRRSASPCGATWACSARERRPRRPTVTCAGRLVDRAEAVEARGGRPPPPRPAAPSPPTRPVLPPCGTSGDAVPARAAATTAATSSVVAGPHHGRGRSAPAARPVDDVGGDDVRVGHDAVRAEGRRSARRGTRRRPASGRAQPQGAGGGVGRVDADADGARPAAARGRRTSAWTAGSGAPPSSAPRRRPPPSRRAPHRPAAPAGAPRPGRRPPAPTLPLAPVACAIALGSVGERRHHRVGGRVAREQRQAHLGGVAVARGGAAGR